MRPHLLLCLALALAAPIAAPASAAPMGYDDARHLLARTGFGPTDAEVGRFAGISRADAVDTLLRETRTQAVTPPPAFVADPAPLR
jgi:hypothetical protein